MVSGHTNNAFITKNYPYHVTISKMIILELRMFKSMSKCEEHDEIQSGHHGDHRTAHNKCLIAEHCWNTLLIMTCSKVVWTINGSDKVDFGLFKRLNYSCQWENQVQQAISRIFW